MGASPDIMERFRTDDGGGGVGIESDTVAGLTKAQLQNERPILLNMYKKGICEIVGCSMLDLVGRRVEPYSEKRCWSEVKIDPYLVCQMTTSTSIRPNRTRKGNRKAPPQKRPTTTTSDTVLTTTVVGTDIKFRCSTDWDEFPNSSVHFTSTMGPESCIIRMPLKVEIVRQRNPFPFKMNLKVQGILSQRAKVEKILEEDIYASASIEDLLFLDDTTSDGGHCGKGIRSGNVDSVGSISSGYVVKVEEPSKLITRMAKKILTSPLSSSSPQPPSTICPPPQPKRQEHQPPTRNVKSGVTPLLEPVPEEEPALDKPKSVLDPTSSNSDDDESGDSSCDMGDDTDHLRPDSNDRPKIGKGGDHFLLELDANASAAPTSTYSQTNDVGSGSARRSDLGVGEFVKSRSSPSTSGSSSRSENSGAPKFSASNSKVIYDCSLRSEVIRSGSSTSISASPSRVCISRLMLPKRTVEPNGTGSAPEHEVNKIADVSGIFDRKSPNREYQPSFVSAIRWQKSYGAANTYRLLWKEVVLPEIVKFFSDNEFYFSTDYVAQMAMGMKHPCLKVGRMEGSIIKLEFIQDGDQVKFCVYNDNTGGKGGGEEEGRPTSRYSTLYAIDTTVPVQSAFTSSANNPGTANSTSTAPSNSTETLTMEASIPILAISKRFCDALRKKWLEKIGSAWCFKRGVPKIEVTSDSRERRAYASDLGQSLDCRIRRDLERRRIIENEALMEDDDDDDSDDYDDDDDDDDGHDDDYDENDEGEYSNENEYSETQVKELDIRQPISAVLDIEYLDIVIPCYSLSLLGFPQRGQQTPTFSPSARKAGSSIKK